MFLYFYGLERRFFVDQSNEDAKDIVQEVRRLQSLYPDNHSVRRYLCEFLDIAMLPCRSNIGTWRAPAHSVQIGNT